MEMEEAKGQDPQFSQYYANPIYLNPAFAGTGGGPRFALNYRNQWPNLEGNFITTTASYDQHFDAINGGFGLQAVYDRAGEGELTTTQIKTSYSYQLNVTREFTIKAGLEAGIQQRRIDFDNLQWPDQIDPRQGFVRPTEEPIVLEDTDASHFFPDFSTGIMGFTDNYYGGFAVHHIAEPTQSFYDNAESTLPRKFTGHIGSMIPLQDTRDPDSYISPNIAFQRQGNFNQVNFGAYYIHQSFQVGAWFRQTEPNSDAFIAMVGLNHENVNVGYSYDLTVSEARTAVRGSHELSLRIQLDQPRRVDSRDWRELNCPDF